MPLNVRHAHFGSSESPARMLIISSFPMILNLLGDEKFVFDNPFVSTHRYDGAADYFNPRENEEDLLVRTNLVRNIQGIKTRSFEYRGKGQFPVRPGLPQGAVLHRQNQITRSPEYFFRVLYNCFSIASTR